MFQPEVKFEFVRRYCPPSDGWVVFVDIDASEEGRTGGARTTVEAQVRQKHMQKEGGKAIDALKRLGVQVGGNRMGWLASHQLPGIAGDRDIVAFNLSKRRCIVAEVEGHSTGQAEQKVYKAVGQIVSAVNESTLENWVQSFVLVVHGEAMEKHLRRMAMLEKLGVSGVSLAGKSDQDVWVFGRSLPMAAERA